MAEVLLNFQFAIFNFQSAICISRIAPRRRGPIAFMGRCSIIIIITLVGVSKNAIR